MTNKYPYPPAEHSAVPKDMVEVLRDEMRLYPAGHELRLGAITIGRIYANTTLLTGFKRYAQLSKMVDNERTDITPSSGGADFFAGSIMCMHAMLKPLPKPQRQELIHTPIFDPDMDNEKLHMALDDIRTFKATPWQEMLEDQHGDLANCLLDLTANMYQDRPNPKDSEECFGSGFMFAGHCLALQSTPKSC